MDKAQAQILLLILIGALFFGQGIYDFIKKNRSKSHLANNRPRPRPLNNRSTSQEHLAARQVVAPARQKQVNLERKKSSFDNIPPKESFTIDATDTNRSIRNPMAANESQMPNIPHSDTSSSAELRRAVIWSEILKRKF